MKDGKKTAKTKTTTKSYSITMQKKGNKKRKKTYRHKEAIRI